MENTKFKQYKKLKSFLEGKCYRDYPLHLVLGSYLGMMTWKPTRKLFTNYIFLNVKKLQDLESDDIVLTYSTERSDYQLLMSKFAPNVGPQYVRIDNTKKEQINGLLMTISSLLRAVVFLRKVKCSLQDKVVLTCGISVAFKIIDEIEKMDIRCEKYVAFNSSYLIESFLSYYFRKRRIKTYSLQHGLYFNYINEIPFDVMNYENVCANELLLWGEYSKKEVERFMPSSSRCKVYGYPVEAIPLRKSSDIILVLLPRDIYLRESIQLLEYLNKFSESYIIRAHPSILSNIEKMNLYNNISIDRNKTLKETLYANKYKVVIGFNSTSLFEASLYEQDILLFKTKNQEFKNPGFEEISVDADLYECINNIKPHIDNRYFFKEMEKLDEL